MNALAKKEIRLLLPTAAAMLLMVTLVPWCFRDADAAYGSMPVILFFGMVILAVDAFGREFNLGTFPALLAQPVERRQIWRNKMRVLLVAATLIYAAFFASCAARLHWVLTDPDSIWFANDGALQKDFHMAMGASVALLLVGLTGGLWTALLLRQISAAFWISFLAPLGVALLIILVATRFAISTSDTVVWSIFLVAAAVYSLAGFWVAHRLFHRAQDAGWTGGVIYLSRWRYFERRQGRTTARRDRRPLAALLIKEIQLHGLSLLFTVLLVALHLGANWMRAVYGSNNSSSASAEFASVFWMFWLAMPMVIGCMAVAEERKLGVVEASFCQPATRRLQFAVKFAVALLAGVLLGGGMPLLLEWLAVRLGVPNELSPLATFWHDGFLGQGGPLLSCLALAGVTAGLAWTSFFASTLARNFLHALSIFIVAVVGLVASFIFLGYLNDESRALLGFQLWHPWVPEALTLLVLPTVLLWLAWRNFNDYQEAPRLWRRTLAGVASALALVVAGSTVISHRAWEVFERAEVPHGSARFSGTQPPHFAGVNLNTLVVGLPDGRMWFDSLEFDFARHPSLPKLIWAWFAGPNIDSAGPRQFLTGSNWLSATALPWDYWQPGSPSRISYPSMVGIQRDGSLWIDSEPPSTNWTGTAMRRWGTETSWQAVIRQGGSLLLLKQDGTLWRWNTKPTDRSFKPTLGSPPRAAKLERLGADHDWSEIFFSDSATSWARKNNGQVWQLRQDYKTSMMKLEPQPNLEGVNLQTLSKGDDNGMAFVGSDGRLRLANAYQANRGFLPVGRETNWVAVALTSTCMVGLKTDGSLWKWEDDGTHNLGLMPPNRLGIHNDWIGIHASYGGIVTLAADGSLWLWRDAPYYEALAMNPPKQPKYLGTVFSELDQPSASTAR